MAQNFALIEDDRVDFSFVEHADGSLHDEAWASFDPRILSPAIPQLYCANLNIHL